MRDILRESVRGSVDERINRPASFIERLEHNTQWVVERFENERDHKAYLKALADGEYLELYKPREARGLFDGFDQKTEIKGNVLLDEGMNEMWSVLCTASTGTKFNNANAYIGVGSGNTAAAHDQVGLQGASKKYKAMIDSGYPTSGTSQQAVWKSSFGSGEAEFAWEEYTVANGDGTSGDTTSVKNLNRKAASQGTKGANQTWDMTVTIQLSN